MPSTTLDNLFFVPPPLPPSSVTTASLGAGDQFGDALRQASRSDQLDDDKTANSPSSSIASLPPPCPSPGSINDRIDPTSSAGEPSASTSSTTSRTSTSRPSYPPSSTQRATNHSHRRSEENASESSRPSKTSPTSGRREKSKPADSGAPHRQANNSSDDSASQAPAANSQQPSATDPADGSNTSEQTPGTTTAEVSPIITNPNAFLPGSVTGLSPDPVPPVAVPTTPGTPTAETPTPENSSGDPGAVVASLPQTTGASTELPAATPNNTDPTQQVQLAENLVANQAATDPSANQNPNAAPNPTTPDAQTQTTTDPLAAAVATAVPTGALALPVAGRTQSTDTTQIASPDSNSPIALDRQLIAQTIVTAVANATGDIPDAPTADERQRRTDDSTSSQPAASNQPADLTRSETNNGSQAVAPNSAARVSTSSLTDQFAPIAPRGSQNQVDQARFVQRVARAFRAADEQGGQIRLRLSPPELGSLKIDIAIRNGEMTARLEAETTSARSLLLDNLPALRERLAGQNIKIQRFDVDLKQDAAGNGSPNMPQDFAGSRQPSPRFQDSRPIGSVLRTDDVPQSVTQSAAASDGRINIVI